MSIEDGRCNCVAISEKLALCSLHAKIRKGVKACVITATGQKLQAKVVFNRFEDNKVDISVLELDTEVFSNFIPIHGQKVGELDDIFVIGMKLQDDKSEDFSAQGQVNTVRHESSIFESSYPGCAGLSGAHVVTVIEQGQLRVVGIHVAVHGDSAEDSDEESISSEQASQPATRRQSCDGLTTLSQASHGRSTYATICDVARVPDLLTFLDKYKPRLAGKKRKQRK
jgi:hypothetical protein